MSGTVYLVGAGPGDPGLITVRGRDLLRRADVIAHDRLVSEAVLAEAPPGAELVFVGKSRGCHAMPQAAIGALLVDRARRGLEVVRLKGGDPFVFGRGGEEIEALAAAGIPFEIVPGVSSALAAPAAAGISLTRRGVSASFAVVSGHDEDAALAWASLASAVDTLVILMGVKGLARVAALVVEQGRSADTPVAVIGRATTPHQRVVTGTLADIAGRAAAVESPAVVVVGPVVDLARRARAAEPVPALAGSDGFDAEDSGVQDLGAQDFGRTVR